MAYNANEVFKEKEVAPIIADESREVGSHIIAESESHLPKITPDMLPDSIGNYVKDVCERIESPFEIGAVTALTLIGSLIGNKVGIRPKAKDNWTVVPNVWGMIIGKPSIKKTPVYSELYKALGKLEAEAYATYQEEFKKYKLDKELFENAKKEFAKNKNKEEHKPESLIEPEPPFCVRYATSDGTIEAIADILSYTPHGLLVTRDELSGFLKGMDRAGKENERPFYLEAWDGTNGFTVDRIGRGNTFIPKLTLSVLGNIQPSMIKEYVYEAVKGKKADGLLQRFQLCVFVDAIKQQGVDRYPNKVARDAYYRTIEKIAKTLSFTDSAQVDEFGDTPFYRFKDDAQNVFNEWYKANAMEAQEAFNEAMEGHLSKYPSLFASLALIFHVCDLAENGSRFDYRITKENTLKALQLVEVLKAHAERLYSTFEVEEAKRDAKADKVLSFMGKASLPISFRDITLKAGGKPSKDEILKAIKGVYKSAGSKVVSKI
ncbi:MAG: DUF3987 domain-containing protein [Sulfurospirillum cavolei]|nr:DUF3987 domain-containing protein [Sulfurospirillum cavolei]